MITYKEIIDRIECITLNESLEYLKWLQLETHKRWCDKRLKLYKIHRLHKCALFMDNVIEFKKNKCHYDVVDTFTKVGNFEIYKHGSYLYELELKEHLEYYTGFNFCNILWVIADKGYRITENVKNNV